MFRKHSEYLHALFIVEPDDADEEMKEDVKTAQETQESDNAAVRTGSKKKRKRNKRQQRISQDVSSMDCGG